MDNILLVVDDLGSAKAFFFEPGLELEGETTVEGLPVDRLISLPNVRATLALFAVDDLDDVVGRLLAHGAELVGDVVQYKDMYRPC